MCAVQYFGIASRPIPTIPNVLPQASLMSVTQYQSCSKPCLDVNKNSKSNAARSSPCSRKDRAGRYMLGARKVSRYRKNGVFAAVVLLSASFEANEPLIQPDSLRPTRPRSNRHADASSLPAVRVARRLNSLFRSPARDSFIKLSFLFFLLLVTEAKVGRVGDTLIQV